MLRTRVVLLAACALSACAAISAKDAPEQFCAVETGATGNAGDTADGRSVLAKAAQRASVASDASCRIEASTARVRDPRSTFIDVRSARDNDIAWIPRATHLRIDEVATHSLVKASRDVILIGDGKDTARLLRRCEQWQQTGLSQIRVLDGGLPAWRRAGGTLVGNVAQSDKPLLLSERELDEAVGRGETLLMFAHGKPSPALAASKAHVVRLEGQQSLPARAWTRVARSVRGGAVAVVFLARAEDADAWRAAARAQGLRDPLFFAGEASRYDAYLAEQASIASHANRPPPSSCERG